MSHNLKLATALVMTAFAATAFSATTASAKMKKQICVDSTHKSQRVHCGPRKRYRHEQYLRQQAQRQVVQNFHAGPIVVGPNGGGGAGRGQGNGRP